MISNFAIPQLLKHLFKILTHMENRVEAISMSCKNNIIICNHFKEEELLT